jgi:hypothetical protein
LFPLHLRASSPPLPLQLGRPAAGSPEKNIHVSVFSPSLLKFPTYLPITRIALPDISDAGYLEIRAVLNPIVLGNFVKEENLYVATH